MTINVMFDLETWGTEPGCDIRSIGATIFDPLTGEIPLVGAFYLACDNPVILPEPDKYFNFVLPKYLLTRNPQTVKWWNEQGDEAKAAFANPVDLKDALMRFASWLLDLQDDDLRLWSHGPAFDPPILAAAYKAVGLPLPWHYRALRDTRTIMEAAGMDPHKGLEPFNVGTHHHALDDAICQARAVCAAYARLRVGHDVITHREVWRSALQFWHNNADCEADEIYRLHQLASFDVTFEALADHPRLER